MRFFIYLVLGILAVVFRMRYITKRPIKGSGVQIWLPLALLLFGSAGFPLVADFMKEFLRWTHFEIFLFSASGVILSIPMIITTKYEIREDGMIYPKKSTAFIFIAIGLMILKMGFREYLSSIDPITLAMLLYVMGISYLIPWRIVNYYKFLRIKWKKKQLDKEALSSATNESPES